MDKGKKSKTILKQTTLFFIIVICSSLALFVVLAISYMKKVITDDLQNLAKSNANSIEHITAEHMSSKGMGDDNSVLANHITGIMKDRPLLVYVVITKKNGFSIVCTRENWEIKNLDGIWISNQGDPDSGEFIYSDPLHENVLHFTYPYKNSRVAWKWVHVGLSTHRLNEDLRNIYLQTVLAGLFCMMIGLGVSYNFAQNLSKPIIEMNSVTRQVELGDLSVRADVHTRDELETLGDSLNSMIETLQTSQKDLIEAKNFTENIITSMIDLMIVVNPDGTVRKVNQATLDLLGYREDEIIGKSFKIIFSKPDKTEEFFERWQSEVIEKGFIRDYETFFFTRNDEQIPINFTGYTIKDDFEDVIGTVVIARDMREINLLVKNLEQTKNDLTKSLKKLQETQMQLIQTAKMSAIGQLAAGVAHEINNPLSGVLGNAQLLTEILKRAENGDTRQMKSCPEIVELIVESANRCRLIVGDLLSFSRQSGADHVDVEINDVIEKALNITRIQMKFTNINIHKNYKKTDEKIKGNFNRLQQVFINLILNAHRYIEDGGDIFISTRVTPDKKNIEIIVKDTGPGIKKELLDKIFEPFFTTMSVGQGTGAGTGLGLSICYNIVREHNGTIHAESEEGEGAAFIIKVPCSREA